MTHNLDERDWRDIVRRLKKMKCTPLISNQVIRDQLFEDLDVVENWATEIGYPLNDRSNLTRVAQYLSGERRDDSNDQISRRCEEIHLLLASRHLPCPT